MKMKLLLITLLAQMVAMTTMAQIQGSNWQLENTARDLGDGIELHLSGRYDFGNDGSVHAEYKTVTTMAAPTVDGGEGKSVYLVLQLDGTGTYSITDGSLNIDLSTIKKNYYMGEGTYDNMGPAYNGDNTQDAQLTQIWFSSLTDVIVDRFKNVDIKAITISKKTIEGSLMGNKVTLTRID